MEIGEFLKEQYKEYYQNLGVFTNNSGKDILVNYEKGNKETIIVKNGDSWTGVDGFWDTEKQQWYKITDNIDVELTPDGGVRWSIEDRKSTRLNSSH